MAALKTASTATTADAVVAAIKAGDMASFKKPRYNSTRDATLASAQGYAEGMALLKLRNAASNHHRAGNAPFADELAAAIVAALAALVGEIGFDVRRLDVTVLATLNSAAARLAAAAAPAVAAGAGGNMDVDGDGSDDAGADEGGSGTRTVSESSRGNSPDDDAMAVASATAAEAPAPAATAVAVQAASVLPSVRFCTECRGEILQGEHTVSYGPGHLYHEFCVPALLPTS